MENISEQAPESSALHRRVLAVSEILLCSGLPTQVAIAQVLVAIGVRQEVAPGLPALPFVFWLSLADTALVITLMVLLTRGRRESVSALWLGGRPIPREAALGLALVPFI